MDLNSDNIEYIKLKIYEIFNKIQISEKIKSEIKYVIRYYLVQIKFHF